MIHCNTAASNGTDQCLSVHCSSSEGPDSGQAEAHCRKEYRDVSSSPNPSSTRRSPLLNTALASRIKYWRATSTVAKPRRRVSVNSAY